MRRRFNTSVLSSVLWIRRTPARSGLAVAILSVILLEGLSVRLGFHSADVLASGLALGSLYAVVAVGYTMMYSVTGFINFAHGDVFSIGAVLSLTAMEHVNNGMVQYGSFQSGRNGFNLPGITLHLDLTSASVLTILVGMAVAGIVCGVIGALIERLVYRRLRDVPRLVPLLVAIGLSVIIENLLGQWRGQVPFTYPSVLPVVYYTRFGPFSLGAGIRNVDLIVFVFGGVFLFLIDRFVRKTTVGVATQAIEQDREAALMCGIGLDRAVMVTFFVASLCAGAAGMLYGIQQTTVSSTMGLSLGLVAITGALLGGIGNVRGAMLGGLLMGVGTRFIDQLGQGGGSGWRDVVVFLILVMVFAVRPNGLLGSDFSELA
jgi:branched-chain amino acid transport system permease protein